jgi:hypothetical protein
VKLEDDVQLLSIVCSRLVRTGNSSAGAERPPGNRLSLRASLPSPQPCVATSDAPRAAPCHAGAAAAQLQAPEAQRVAVFRVKRLVRMSLQALVHHR